MEPTVLALILCVAALAVGLAAAIVVLSVRLRRQRALLAERERAHACERADLERAHAAILEARAADEAAERRATTQEYEAALVLERASVAEHQRRTESLLEYSRRGIRWEQRSLDDLTGALSDARIDAVVATNVVFAQDTGRSSFVAQIDHVVVTERAAVVVENKRWRGVVFDSVDLRSVHPAFATLFRDDQLGEGFAVQLRREAEGEVTVRIERDPRTLATGPGTTVAWRPPRQQARMQAVRLKEALQRQSKSVPWISTVVYYSHPDATVFAAPGRSDGGDDPTTVVSSRGELTHCLRRELAATAGRPNGPVRLDVEGIADILNGWGADLRGTGQWAARWPARF